MKGAMEGGHIAPTLAWETLRETGGGGRWTEGERGEREIDWLIDNFNHALVPLRVNAAYYKILRKETVTDKRGEYNS